MPHNATKTNKIGTLVKKVKYEMGIQLFTAQLDNGEVLSYRRKVGKGKTIILVHGNMTSSKHWDLFLESFTDDNHLIAVDLRGFGFSTYRKPIDSIKDFSNDLALFAKALRLDSFILVGWSMGGAVSMQFSIDHPHYVEKLILLTSASTRGFPYFHLTEQGESARSTKKSDIATDKKSIDFLAAYEKKDVQFLQDFWNRFIYTTKRPTDLKYSEYIDDMVKQRNLVECYHALNRFNISSFYNGAVEGTNEVSKLKVPTLVLSGETDLIVTEKMTEELLEDLGSQAESYVLKGCGHSPFIDDLEQLKQQIVNFIK